MSGSLTNLGGGMLQNAAANSPILRAMQDMGAVQSPPTQPSVSPLPPPIDVATAPAVAEKGRNLLWRQAIADIESGGGNYRAVGPTTKTGDRALGKYQIMGNNIPQWTKEVFGQSMTPEEFLNNDDAQDIVFDAKFGQYVNQYGEEGAAQAWLGGPGSVGKTGRADQLGTSVGDYGQRFMAGLGKPSTPQAPKMSPLERIFSAGTTPPQSAIGASTGASETAATSAPKSALDRVLEAALKPRAPVQMPQTEVPQVAPAVNTGAQQIASATQSALEQARSPSQRAAARKEALKARVRGQNV